MSVLNLVIPIVCIALLFDYVNGFHDAANSVATGAVRWNVAQNIAVAWIITIPAAALVSGLAFVAIRFFVPNA